MAKQGGGKLANSLGSFFGVTRYGSETEELSEGMQDVHSHDSTDEASIPSTETPAPSPGIRLNALPTPASANPDTAAMPQATGAAEPLSVESEAITASSAYQTSAQRQETNQFAATYTPIPHREQKTNREEYQVQNHYETDEYPYPSSGYDQVHELDVTLTALTRVLVPDTPTRKMRTNCAALQQSTPAHTTTPKLLVKRFVRIFP